MNFRLTVFLVLILLIVGGAGIWTMWHPKGDAPATTTLANPVFKPQPKSIQAISLSRRQAVEIAFARTNDHWEVTAPIHSLANEQPGVFADQIRNLEYKDKFTPESSGLRSLETMGLSDPRATLTFTDDEKKTTTLQLGKRTPAKTLFMRIEGDSSNTVYEVDVRWLDDLEKDPTDFRSKEFAGVTPADVTSLTVGHAKQAVTLTKDGAAGTWSITKPVATRANTTVITDVLEALRETQIESFSTLTADNPITGLASPVLTVAVTTRVGPSAPPTTAASQPAASQASGWKLTALSFGNYSDLTKKSIYARIGDSPEAVVVSADKFNKINKELNDLRDPAITPAPVDAASTIEILTPGSERMGLPEKMTLSRKMGTWQIASNQSRGDLPGDSPAIEAFLGNLKTLRANKYVDGAGDLKTIGLDPPVQSISLTITGQAAPEVIEIGKPQSAEPLTPVHRKGEQTVYLVQTPDLTKLAISLLNFRDRNVEFISPDLIHSIEISGNKAHKVTLDHQGTTWKLLKDGKTLSTDASAMTAYLGNFTPVTARKWISTLPQRAQPLTASIRIIMDAPTTKPASTLPAILHDQNLGPATAPGTMVKILNIYEENDGSYSAEFMPPAETELGVTGWNFEPAAELVRQTLTEPFEPAPSTQTGTKPATAPATAP